MERPNKRVLEIIENLRYELKGRVGEGRNGYTADAATIIFLFEKTAEQQVEIESLKKQISKYKVAMNGNLYISK